MLAITWDSVIKKKVDMYHQRNFEKLDQNSGSIQFSSFGYVG